MSMVSDWMPSVSITSCACARLAGLDVRYGMRTPITFSLPSASTARNAVSDESTPPDTPTIPFVKPRRRTTSSFRKLTNQRRASSQSMCRGSPASTPFPTMWIADCGLLIADRSEEHTSELQSLAYLVCRLLLEKKKKKAKVML